MTEKSRTTDSAQKSVRAALADLVALQRRPNDTASRPDTKAGGDRAVVAGQVLPALDRVLALLAFFDALEDGPERDEAVAGIRDVLWVLKGASDALFDEEAKRSLRPIIDCLGSFEDPS